MNVEIYIELLEREYKRLKNLEAQIDADSRLHRAGAVMAPTVMQKHQIDVDMTKMSDGTKHYVEKFADVANESFKRFLETEPGR